ncbi:MAG: SpoIIE family protein phosphatase [Butyrivibrio sp.]|nr:SpoIIE family protein phosphatase [Butyrivibrio sp.]
MHDSRNLSKILVVDDEKLIRLTISAKLKSAGYVPVAVGTVDEAVALLNASHQSYMAIITDIVMGDVDGFAFRDVVRGIDKTIPIFFMTALDPEEGSGFLKRIIQDPTSYYLPKSADVAVLLKRVQRVVGSRRIEQFIQQQMEESKKSLTLAAHVQASMLPARMIIAEKRFHSIWWRPRDSVSGDLVEAVPYGKGRCLYVLGDIQGHGTSAALAMTAVQSFLKIFSSRENTPNMSPSNLANLMHRFFRRNLADVSYMTAIICIHNLRTEEVCWISCGAPDLVVVDDRGQIEINPEKRGGLPIGLVEDTVYTADDEVVTKLPPSAVCLANTDGLTDLSCDEEGNNRVPETMIRHLRDELIEDSRPKGCLIAMPYKFMRACEEMGYNKYQDDVTLLMFGARSAIPGFYEMTVQLSPESIDAAAQEMGAWCTNEGWSEDAIMRMQLVFEEKMMNVHDHGFDDRDRMREVTGCRLRRVRDEMELTIWDCGTPEPSIEVAAGNSGTAFELVNRDMSNHGRGRLMVRELCKGVERNRYGILNETVYHIPYQTPATEGEIAKKGRFPR